MHFFRNLHLLVRVHVLINFDKPFINNIVIKYSNGTRVQNLLYETPHNVFYYFHALGHKGNKCEKLNHITSTHDPQEEGHKRNQDKGKEKVVYPEVFSTWEVGMSSHTDPILLEVDSLSPSKFNTQLSLIKTLMISDKKDFKICFQNWFNLFSKNMTFLAHIANKMTLHLYSLHYKTSKV